MPLTLGRVRPKFIWGLIIIFLLGALVSRYGNMLYLRAYSYAWHVAHHDVARAGTYEIPIGRNWLVSDRAWGLTLLDLNAAKRKQLGSITINVFNSRDLRAGWNSPLQDKSNFLVLNTRDTYKIGNEEMSCFDYNMNLPNAQQLATVECNTPTLRIFFWGTRQEVPSFKEWLHGIRKAP